MKNVQQNNKEFCFAKTFMEEEILFRLFQMLQKEKNMQESEIIMISIPMLFILLILPKTILLLADG